MKSHTSDYLEPYHFGTSPNSVILCTPSPPGPTALRLIESRMDHLKPNSCRLHDVCETNIHILAGPSHNEYRCQVILYTHHVLVRYVVPAAKLEVIAA